MTTKTKRSTPMTTKAAPKPAPAATDPKTEESGTKLAQVDDPAKLTPAKIDEITKDDGTDDRENSANKDAAETLRQAKADAQSKGDPERGYFHGQGGGAGDL